MGRTDTVGWRPRLLSGAPTGLGCGRVEGRLAIEMQPLTGQILLGQSLYEYPVGVPFQ